MGHSVGHLILCRCWWQHELVWLGGLSLHGLENLAIFSLDFESAWCCVLLYNNGGATRALLLNGHMDTNLKRR